MKNNNFIVILAGGGGTRLWPKSRQSFPKQFIKLFGDETLLQNTYERIKEFTQKENIYVITSGNFRAMVQEQIDLPSTNILVEPKAAGTAAAIGLAAIHIRAQNQNAIISTIASDHYIEEPDRFLSVLDASQEIAASGNYIVTMGLTPTFPHTGLGYIRSGEKVTKAKNHTAFKVLDFVEKPSKATAEDYILSGEYFWNANINSYLVSTIFTAFKNFKPLLLEALEQAAAALGTPQENTVVSELWNKLEIESIDTAVLEKATNVLMIPADFAWLDIGDWAILHDLLAEKKTANVVIGDKKRLFSLDSKGSLIHTDSRLIATVGVDNLVIIDTPDVLLITTKKKAQQVKVLVEELKKGQLKELL